MLAIHGHDVMQMMLDSKKLYTKASLIADITEKYGEDTRFFTCSAEDLTAEALVDFLEQKGKFTPVGENFQTDASKICNHG